MKKIINIIFKILKIDNSLLFLGSTDILPPPLTKEEELQEIIKSKEGNLQARNKLIEHNLRLVVFISKKYESTGYDLEDLVSIGTIGLIKGIETYKPDKNIRLATYASRCIANEILMYIRKNKKRKTEVSLEDAINYDLEGNELHLEDILGTDENIIFNEFSNKLDKDILKKELYKLNEREKQIIILRYGLEGSDEYTQKEVANLLGISQSYISRIEKKIIRKLQTAYEIKWIKKLKNPHNYSRRFFMGKYKVEITGINTNKLKVLKNEETIELFKQYQNGNKQAKEEIINGNLKLVLSIIKHYNTGKFDMNDLFQIGTIGLIKAVDNFSLDYNVRFCTYAVPLILGEVKKFIRESSIVRISRSIKDNAYQILKYKEEYLIKHGTEPSSKQICKHLNITQYDYSLALESLIEPISLSEPIYNDGGDTIYLEDQLSNQKDEIDNQDTISLQTALKKINTRERNVLYSRYIYGKTQLEIAADLGVSQAQVSRIEKSAITNMKKYLK